MNDDELALLGAPWAKEGMLQHKLYWESTGKRAKKSDWKQYFVVISKGELFMFTFGEKGSSSFVGGTVGGGNWLVSWAQKMGG
jgi:PH/SEC7 domain-containing protein